mgnify:CR=1 FL=1
MDLNTYQSLRRFFHLKRINLRPMDKLFLEKANSWLGTPWKNGVSLKGFGTDCIQLIIGISKEMKWLPDNYESIRYNQDYAYHNSESILLQELSKHADQIELKDAYIGDVLVFKNGRCANS